MDTGVQRGNVASDLVLDKTPNGQEVVSFSVAVDEFRRGKNGPEKVGASFAKVKVWGEMGRNALASLKKGDPVVFGGRATTSAYVNRAGEPIVDTVIQADYIAPDLRYATAVVEQSSVRKEPAPQVTVSPVEQRVLPQAPPPPAQQGSVSGGQSYEQQGFLGAAQQLNALEGPYK